MNLMPETGRSSREGYVDAEEGIRLFYRVVGSRPETIVMIHGGPGFSMAILEGDMAPLAERYRLVFYDQRGSGRSTLVSDAAGLHADRFVDDLERLRVELDLGSMTLLGHSWGSGLAALYARRHPNRVARLISVCGIPLRREQLAGAFDRIRAGREPAEREALIAARDAWLADRGNVDLCREWHRIWFLPFVVDKTVLSRTRADFCHGGPEVVMNMGNPGTHTVSSLGDYDLAPSLGALTAPALIVHGEHDVFQLASAQAWAEALPNGRLVVLENVGHFPQFEAPERFFPAIHDFMQQSRPAGG